MSCSEFIGRRRVQIVIYTTIALVSFILLITFTVKTLVLRGPHRTSSVQQEEWVALHNQRREYYHNLYNGEYVPVKWSDSVADQSQAWADSLVRGRCENYRHDPDNEYGENLAVIWGSDSIERVMRAWVEEEELGQDEPYKSGHGHMTQVLWRATHYVGCAQASNDACHIYVCRYVRPGNCNRGTWTWLNDMMADDSPCSPHCPEEGCF